MKMKKHTAILIFLISTTLALAQKKDQIKGSKTVTVESKEIGHFNSIEINDNLEIYLEKGEVPGIKIEADDNLHDIIRIDLKENALRLFTTKEVVKSKKLIVKVTYTNELNRITVKDKATVNAIQEIQLNTINISSLGSSNLFINANVKNFILQSDDKSKTELNLKSENAKLELSNNASLKALISTVDFTSDLYQKSTATIEGDATNATIRLDNNSVFTGKKLTIKNVDLITESYSGCSINADTTISIAASDKSEIGLYGSPKIDLKKFSDEAKLFKK
jgi:hypothetical protein